MGTCDILSLDCDFDELQDKDKTVELVGFICSVEAPMKQKNYDLFKFGLSNGTRKVMCLTWGIKLINKIQPTIVLNKILHLNGAYCQLSKYPSFLEKQGFVLHELIIKETTTMNFIGDYEPIPLVPEVPPKLVTFDNIMTAEGKISIEGFIKTEFTAVASHFQNATYACGSITDGVHKIVVNISNYSTPVNSERGMPITVIGNVINDTNVPLTITCENSSYIVARENIQRLPELQVLRANRVLKRKLASE